LQLETLQRLLGGETQKVLGIDNHCAPSTVAARAKETLRQIGLEGTPRLLPTGLLAIFHACWGMLPVAASDIVSTPGPSCGRSISIRRPDPRRCGIFSDSEAHIAEMLVEGVSRSEMCRQRQTRPRTIANQMANLYRKMGVSGRIPFLIGLLHQSSDNPSNGAQQSGNVC
jgi:DNA-binding CsgD family transcriptional regulator